MDRFWSKVAKAGLDDCWQWTASVRGKGYGSFRFEGKMLNAHRVAYVLTDKPLKSGELVLHKCDVKRCCNPRHLYAGTHRDNARDSWARGRLFVNWSAHKLTRDQVVEIRRLHAEDGVSRYRLARMFGVGERAVRKIIHRTTYKWI